MNARSRDAATSDGTRRPSSSIRRILVAIKDPTAPTPASVLKAAQLARALDAELVLFHAIDLPLYAEAYEGGGRDLGEDEDSIRAHLLHNLAAQAASCERRGLSISVAAEWDYPAHEAVLRHAQNIQADLIVTERHPYPSRTPWAWHTTDWEMLRLSPQPLLIVKNATPYLQPVTVAAVDPMNRHDRPAALDTRLCRLAEAITEALGGVWHAMHASGGDAGWRLERAAAMVVRRSRVPLCANAEAAMDRLLAPTRIRPQSVQLQDLPPADAIIETVGDLGAAILVMGAMSRTGLKRLLIGNTAEQVIDRVSCDVLVGKPIDFGVHFGLDVRGPRMLSIATTPPLS